jgi:triacylglycerol esterase/lipase EstA (alpha/beta hydrolase family)
MGSSVRRLTPGAGYVGPPRGRYLVAIVVALAVAVAGAGAAPGSALARTFAPVDHPGPALDVPAAKLAASLKCSPGFGRATREPVLLVPGTGITAAQEFSWNYEPALSDLGIEWCGVTFPDSGNDDMQVNGEYVVYAIRTMYRLAGHRIAIYGHSQGGMVPRWALRFWPDTRTMVDDVVGAAGPNHGTIVANAACNGTRPCQPSDWQSKTTSNFIAALNSGQETFPGISYTEIYSHYDEEVQPNQNSSGTSSLHGGGGQITNVAVQDVCPDDTSEHLALGSYDPVTWTLLLDALNHPGPAVPSRVGLTPCTEQFMPGVDPATFATNASDAVIDVETSPAQSLSAEGPLACYTTASCAPVAPACPRLRVVRIALPAIGRDRIVAVTVRDGRTIVARVHGRDLHAVRVRIREHAVTLWIVTVSRRGVRRTTLRRYGQGCRTRRA